MPPGAVYVGRGTRWGNPCRVVRNGKVWEAHVPWGGLFIQRFPTRHAAHVFAVEAYKLRTFTVYPENVKHARDELRGKDLVCWCPDDLPCHADVLLEVANGE